jgi:hypothetical protein
MKTKFPLQIYAYENKICYCGRICERKNALGATLAIAWGKFKIIVNGNFHLVKYWKKK